MDVKTDLRFITVQLRVIIQNQVLQINSPVFLALLENDLKLIKQMHILLYWSARLKS